MALNLNKVVNGRICSVIFKGPVSMNKGGRGGVPVNPLLDLPVTKRIVMALQACSRESYKRRMLKQDPTWQPSETVSGYEATSHPCVDKNLKTGDFALRAVPVGNAPIKHQVWVGGELATPEQLETIAAYQTGGKFYAESQTKSKPAFMRLPLAKIEHEGWTDASVE